MQAETVVDKFFDLTCTLAVIPRDPWIESQ